MCAIRTGRERVEADSTRLWKGGVQGLGSGSKHFNEKIPLTQAAVKRTKADPSQRWASTTKALLIITYVCLLWGTSFGQNQSSNPLDDVSRNLPNATLPTFGGTQFWTYYDWRNGWRLQRHALTQHWRLLDDKYVRKAWGTSAECRA